MITKSEKHIFFSKVLKKKRELHEELPYVQITVKKRYFISDISLTALPFKISYSLRDREQGSQYVLMKSVL